MKHLVWCDTQCFPDEHLPCNCPGPQMAIQRYRAERERCAKIADAFAEDARYEYAGEQQTAAADMARRIARAIRLIEDEGDDVC